MPETVLPIAPSLPQVHKSKAVVRFMFHSPDDVRWFRPVELWTKAGRRGRIREPVRALLRPAAARLLLLRGCCALLLLLLCLPLAARV